MIISDILFFKFLRDFQVSRKEQSILGVLSNVVSIGFLFILLSGLALYLPATARYNQNPAFLLKMLVSTAIFMNGLFMHFFLVHHLTELSFGKEKEHANVYQLRHSAYASGAISVTSWCSALIISIFKPYMQYPLLYLLTVYITILCIAVVTSQIVLEHAIRKGKKFEWQSAKKNSK